MAITMRHLPLLFSLCAGCSSQLPAAANPSPTEARPTPPAHDAHLNAEGCSAGVVQDDLTYEGTEAEGTPPNPPRVWFGPNVGASGELTVQPGAVVSTTYLRLKLDDPSLQRFSELTAPVVAAFFAADGMLAASIANSRHCGLARTLAVWRDEAAMMKFVTSAEHMAAIADISEVSRGGSITTHWTANKPEDASWPVAAEKLKNHRGRQY